MSGQSGVAAHGYEFVQVGDKPKKKKDLLHEGLEMYADKESQHRFVVKRQTSGDSRNQTSVNKAFYHVLTVLPDDLLKSGQVGIIFIKSKLPIKEVTKTVKRPGYEIRHEVIDGKEYGSSDVTLRSAYTPDGDYIGDPRMANMLCVKRGIVPEKSDPKHNVCSVGRCERNNSWVGWSHRAIHEFKIGDQVKEGDVTSLNLPVGFKAKTLEDAKKMAIAFARGVS